MEISDIYMIIGFSLAAYSVVANDSVQTLGTFIASNSEKFKWYILAGAAASILSLTLFYGWYMYDDMTASITPIGKYQNMLKHYPSPITNGVLYFYSS